MKVIRTHWCKRDFQNSKIDQNGVSALKKNDKKFQAVGYKKTEKTRSVKYKKQKKPDSAILHIPGFYAAGWRPVFQGVCFCFDRDILFVIHRVSNGQIH